MGLFHLGLDGWPLLEEGFCHDRVAEAVGVDRVGTVAATKPKPMAVARRVNCMGWLMGWVIEADGPEGRGG